MRANPKFVMGATMIVAAIAYLAYLGASSSWQYYVLVDECMRQPEQWQGKRLRISGQLAEGSLAVDAEQRTVTFVLSGKECRLAVSYHGGLPDNLHEGMDLLVEGSLRGRDGLEAERIITRCASKYNPKAPSPSAAEVSEPPNNP